MTELWTGATVAPPGNTGKYERAILIPDVHCGDQDDRAILLALRVIAAVRPTIVVQLGDVLDFSGLSRFDNDPARVLGSVKRELEIQHALYGRLNDILPRRAQRFQLEGNHEVRLERFLWRNPAMLDSIKLATLMRLGEFGFGDRLLKSHYLNSAFLVRHGSRIRQDAGQSAKAEVLSTMISGASGHTHRMATYSFSSEGVDLSWTECGHLQNRTPTWLDSRPNWQSGLVMVEVEVDGNAFNVTPIHFRRSYRCVVNGMELRA